MILRRKRERESQEIRMQELRYDHGNLADFEIAESNVTRGLPVSIFTLKCDIDSSAKFRSF